VTLAIKHGGNIDDRRRQALAASKRKRESGAGGKRHERHDRLSLREALQRDRAVEASRTYFAIIAVVAIMVLLGLVMLLSASGPLRAAGDGSPYSMVIRQSVFAGAGLALMSVVIRVRYQLFRRLITLIWAVGLGMMALPLVPGWSHTVNDANSWVSVGGMTFQPSEIFKLCLERLAPNNYPDRGGHEPRVYLQPDSGRLWLCGRTRAHRGGDVVHCWNSMDAHRKRGECRGISWGNHGVCFSSPVWANHRIL